MIKKITSIVFIVLLFFTGIIVLTQEADSFFVGPQGTDADHEGIEFADNEHGEYEEYGEGIYFGFWYSREIPEWVLPLRWFRSNAGGMAIEEMQSGLAALRQEHALAIEFTTPDKLPEYLAVFYDDSFFIETRRLYRNGIESRKQWIFRDGNGTTRLIAVLSEINNEDNEGAEIESAEAYANEFIVFEEIYEGRFAYENEEMEIYEPVIIARTLSEIERMLQRFSLEGFIEIFNEDAFITSEYRFFDDGTGIKTVFNYNEGVVISANSFSWDEEGNAGPGFFETYTDYFRYNRSMFLRSIERVFLRDQLVTAVSFPGNIVAAARDAYFTAEKHNPIPLFFGDLFVTENTRLVSTTDVRGRVLTQTLYNDNEENDIIWRIVNTWSGDRILSMEMTEGDTVLVAEFTFDSNDNRIFEKNFRNGVLERTVRTEGNIDIEELFFNDAVVLQAVWEDGRRISETRVRSN